MSEVCQVCRSIAEDKLKMVVSNFKKRVTWKSDDAHMSTHTHTHTHTHTRGLFLVISKI